MVSLSEANVVRHNRLSASEAVDDMNPGDRTPERRGHKRPSSRQSATADTDQDTESVGRIYKIIIATTLSIGSGRTFYGTLDYIQCILAAVSFTHKLISCRYDAIMPLLPTHCESKSITPCLVCKQMWTLHRQSSFCARTPDAKLLLFLADVYVNRLVSLLGVHTSRLLFRVLFPCMSLLRLNISVDSSTSTLNL